LHDKDEKRRLADFLKQIRARGMTFYDILYTLDQLRVKTSLNIPNLTQTLKATPSSIEAEALIPVLLELIDDLLQTSGARTYLDKFKEESIEIRKEYYSAMKEEKEKWSTQRTALLEEKKEAKEGFDLTKWKRRVSGQLRVFCYRRY
jgi:hypothetical protein